MSPATLQSAAHLRDADEVIASLRRSRRRRRRLSVYVGTDTAVLLLAALAAAFGTTRYGGGFQNIGWAVAYVAVTLITLELRGFYGFRLNSTPVDDLGRIIAATAIAAMVTLAARVVAGETLVADHTARLWVFATVFLGAGRAGLAFETRRERRAGLGGMGTLIVGAGTVGQLVAKRLNERPELGLRPVGFLDKEPLPDVLQDPDSPPVLGASWDLEEVIADHDVEQVVITFSTAPHAVLLDIMRRCYGLGVDVAVVPRLFEKINNRIGIEHLGGVPFLRAEQVDPRGWQFAVKYALDRVLAAIALVAIAPILTVIALAVRASSPGPIFFRQRRVGLDGREFDMLKFRTMREVDGAGEADAAWAARHSGVAVLPTAHSPVDRRTPIGRVLRDFSLDELPQLINVLKGDMSFVGPRPERTTYARTFEQHIHRYGERHRVRSGLTGWAQVQGLRGDTSLSDRVEWDNYYIENWSLLLDLKILFLTVPALFGAGGRNK